MEQSDPILQVKNLKVYFPLKRSVVQMITHQPRQYVRAVDGVSFEIGRGQTLAVVGESGCGKTTLAKTLVWLNRPHEGQILYNGRDIATDEAWKTNELRKDIQYIFQNPYGSLNPKMTVLETVKRPLEIFNL